MTVTATTQASAPSAFIVGDWGHIFDGEKFERSTRIVIDAVKHKLIFMEVQQDRALNCGFRQASRIEMADVEESLINANAELFDNPDDFGLSYTNEFPATSDKHVCAHELTFEMFAAQAVVEELTNHGRRWNVVFAGRDSCFSDAATQELAKRDAHRSAVNNALYFNLPDSPAFGDKPSIPPVEVLAQYPEVVARFPELGLSLTPPSQQPGAGTQLSMIP